MTEKDEASVGHEQRTGRLPSSLAPRGAWAQPLSQHIAIAITGWWRAARSIRPTNDEQILVVPGDITDRKTAERAISEGMARFGRIDTLINNAGVFRRQAVHFR